MGVLTNDGAARGSQASRNAESTLRNLLDSSLLGVLYIAEDTIVFANRTALRLLDLPTERVVGQPVQEVMEGLHSDQRHDLIDGYRRASPETAARDARTEVRWCRPDGSVRWFEVQSVGASFEGRPALQVVFVDVTQRHEALDRLSASEERYRRMVESSPSGILVHSQGRVVLANKAAVALFGFRSESDMLGKHFLDYIDRQFHPVVQERVERVYGAGDSVPVIEVVLLRLDGSSFWAEASAGAVEHEGRRGSMVVFRDISERKKAELENARLEAQLLQSQKLEAIGRLAGGVAHDFNNLLTEITGQAELAMMDIRSDHSHYPMLKAVGDAAQRASALTRQLLAFSRRQALLPCGILLNDIVSGLETMLRRLIGEDIEFQIALSPEAGLVTVDPGQIEQVVLNLCVNARDAMPAGGRLLITTAGELLDDLQAAAVSLPCGGRYSVLSVVDNGCGMTPEVLCRLFEPFFTTKPKEVGTGLGLSTSYGIIRQHQGSIEVKSAPGKGSVFRIFLPRSEEEMGEKAARAVEEPLRVGGETVLCVEDEALVREVTVTMVKRLGYRVLEADSPSRALAISREHDGPIHLLITDIVMPQMNGRELAERLVAERPDLAVICTSGYTEDVFAHQGLLDRSVRFLGKPFTLRTLAGEIRNALDGDDS
ncbi:MAG: PAS domain S-box protein [Deltaproteobacteria bacterium]|nr:PAS domain S-box protein [Deltaproteobacteria bacterium]